MYAYRLAGIDDLYPRGQQPVLQMRLQISSSKGDDPRVCKGHPCRFDTGLQQVGDAFYPQYCSKGTQAGGRFTAQVGARLHQHHAQPRFRRRKGSIDASKRSPRYQ